MPLTDDLFHQEEFARSVSNHLRVDELARLRQVLPIVNRMYTPSNPRRCRQLTQDFLHCANVPQRNLGCTHLCQSVQYQRLLVLRDLCLQAAESQLLFSFEHSVQVDVDYNSTQVSLKVFIKDRFDPFASLYFKLAQSFFRGEQGVEYPMMLRDLCSLMAQTFPTDTITLVNYGNRLGLHVELSRQQQDLVPVLIYGIARFLQQATVQVQFGYAMPVCTSPTDSLQSVQMWLKQNQRYTMHILIGEYTHLKLQWIDSVLTVSMVTNHLMCPYPVLRAACVRVFGDADRMSFENTGEVPVIQAIDFAAYPRVRKYIKFWGLFPDVIQHMSVKTGLMYYTLHNPIDPNTLPQSLYTLSLVQLMMDRVHESGGQMHISSLSTPVIQYPMHVNVQGAEPRRRRRYE